MENKVLILGLSGKIGSGKDSAASYILGQVLVNRKVIEQSSMTDDGRLLVNYEKDNGERGMGVLDIGRMEPSFVNWMNEVVWPHVKVYHFADKLKIIANDLYGLEVEKIFGTQSDKEEKCHITFGQIKELIPKSVRPSYKDKDVLSNREFLQYFADVLRSIDDMCFVNSLLNQVLIEQPSIAIIADVRSPKEAEAIRNIGGKTIRFTRETKTDGHSTETAFDGLDLSLYFDKVVDNKFCDIHEKNKQVLESLKEWNVLV